jgi:DNA modification methylase
VTSPPYFGLRDYGTARWEGGDSACEHKVGRATRTLTEASAKQQTSVGSYGDESIRNGGNCPHCGALRVDSQIGLEETPELYVAKLVEVFREVRRVLRDDGTLWLNVGDSYWGGKGENGSSKARATASERGYQQSGGTVKMSKRPQDGTHAEIKPKDLCGIPWMLAFALRADGWYLRSEIIWHKPNPMPESVTDRPTKAHEQIFLFAKSPRYYYDAEAVLEPFADERMGNPGVYRRTSAGERKACNDRQDLGFINNGGGWNADGSKVGRNRRSVWTVTTKPYRGAHFATFPEDLIKPCVLAGSKEGDTILDPFCGAGTTGLVAAKHGRDFIGIELNPEYAEMGVRRIEGFLNERPLLREAVA